MADNNIALGVQVPDSMKSISGMLNFVGQAQGVQQRNLELEKNRIILGERKGIQQLFSDPSRFTGEDGTPDYNKLISEGMKVAPTTFPTMVPQIISAQKEGTAAKSALNNLNEQQRVTVSQFVMSLGNDTPEVAKQKLDAFVTLQPQLKPAAEFAWKYQLAPAAQNPEAWKAATLKVGQSVMGPAEQKNALTPSYVSTGGSLQQTNPVAAANGAPASVPVTLGPGNLETVEQGPDRQPYIVTRSPQGTILGTRSLAGGPQGGTGGAGGMPKFNPGDAEAVPVLEAERTQARNVLASAPIAHTTNRGILTELDHVLATGQTGNFLAKAASIAGIGPKIVGANDAERAASAYDLIGKYTERNALEAAKAMGPGTNAGLEAAIKANGSAAYNPTALKKITKLNDAIVSGAEMYQPGLEKAIAANPQRGVLAKREFDQAWAQNFDPLVMELHNAQQSGDSKAIAEIVKEIGGKDSKRAKDLVMRARNIEKLSTTGSLN